MEWLYTEYIFPGINIHILIWRYTCIFKYLYVKYNYKTYIDVQKYIVLKVDIYMYLDIYTYTNIYM